MYTVGKKRNIFIALFVLFAVFLGVGYALITSNVEIKGTTDIPSASWDVHFDNLVVSDGSVSALAADAAKISSDSMVITYNVALNKPGDFYEFTVDVINNGTLDAKIEKTEVLMTNVTSGSSVDPTSYANYTVVDASTGNALAVGELLNANGGTRKIKIRVEYRTDIEAADLPLQEQTLKLTYTLNYIQA